jgi:hypothetical protein
MWRRGMEALILVLVCGIPRMRSNIGNLPPRAIVVGGQELQLPVDQFMLVMNWVLARQVPQYFPLPVAILQDLRSA